MKPYILALLIALVSAAKSEEGDKNAISETSDGSVAQSIHDSVGPYVSGVAGAAKSPFYPGAKPYYPAAVAAQAAAIYPAVIKKPFYQSAAIYPAVGAKYPAVSAKYPAVGARYPAMGAKYPAVGAKYPAVGAKYPAAGAKYPAVGAKYPAVGAKYPAVGAKYPAVGAKYPAVGAVPIYPAAAKLPNYPAVIPKPYQQANYLDGQPTTTMELPEAEETLHANHEETLPENSDAPGDNPAERNTSGQAEKTITENSACAWL